MVAASVAEDFARIFTPPPSLDLAMLVIGDDLKKLEKAVDQFETEMIRWRASLLPKLQPALDELQRVLPETSDIERTVTEGIRVVEDGIAGFSKPMHADPAIAELLHRLGNLSPSAGKFVRKLMRRVEKVRVAQQAFLVDIYYGLLAFKSEVEEHNETGASFDDPARLGAFLRNQMV